MLSTMRTRRVGYVSEDQILPSHLTVARVVDFHRQLFPRWDDAMASNFQFCPNIDEMDYDTTPPVLPDEEGRYPVPVPGVWEEI